MGLFGFDILDIGAQDAITLDDVIGWSHSRWF